MKKGCDSCNYRSVTVKGNDFQGFILSTNNPEVESVKSIIIFIVLSIVLLIGLSLLPKSPVVAVRYQYHYMQQQ